MRVQDEFEDAMEEEKIRNTDLSIPYEIVNSLKQDINEFLFVRMPGEATLDEVEKIACDLHSKIFSSWEFHSK